MYAMKIVPPVGTRRGQEARLSLVVTGGSRGIILPSVQYFASSVWKIHSFHDCLGQQPSLSFPMVRIRSFSYVP